LRGPAPQPARASATSFIPRSGHSSYALPTQLTSPSPNTGEPQQTAYSQYDYSTGLLVGFKDRNGVVTQTLYNDAFDRPTQINAALGTSLETHTAFYYAPALVFGVNLMNNDVLKAQDQASLDDGLLRRWTKTDGFGRAVESWTDDPQGDVRAATTYDGLGRRKRVTNPFRSTADPTYGYTDTTYDLAGRVTRLESFGGAGSATGAVTTAYNGARVLVTDQAGKKRLSQSDGLGRLLTVWEVTAADSASEALSFPGHAEIAAGYRTSYSYDALDDLTQVTQRVGTGGTLQSRPFSYDGLKRLTSATNPESGAVSYQYDANSNLTQKLDGRGITASYAYDGLNRLTSRSYSNDPQTGQSTPAVFYSYDTQSLPAGAPSYTLTNPIGRLVALTYGGGSSGSYLNYDEMGRVSLSVQQTDGLNYPCGYGYNLAGALTRESYPSGRVVATEYDTAGRVAGVKNAATGAYWAGATPTDATNRLQYAAQGAVTAMKLGNGKWEHTTYNSRLQPTQIGLGTSSTDASLLKLDYGYGTTGNNGNLLSQTISIGATVMSQSYGYDALNRLQSATESGAWSQSYSYDRYGNRAVTSSSGYPLSPLTPTALAAYSAATNRLNANGYDGAGNQTQEGVSRTFTYDAENRQLTFNATAGQYVYDGDGRRVKKVDGTGTTVMVYDAGGRMIAEYTSGSPTGNGTSYITADHLGSTRVVTKSDGTVKARYDYLPFGEELGAGIGQRSVAMGYSASDNMRQKFTAKERDSESGLDYFGARYYSSAQGRFTSSDPGGFSKRHLANPQKWNKYAYTINNPFRFIDPDGEEEFEVVVTTFIPQKQVEAPGRLLVTTRYFDGDDRNVGGDESKYRTQQVIRIETDPNKNGGNPEVKYSRDVGESVERDSDGKVIARDKANGDTLGYSIARGDDGTVKIHVYGNESNPLVSGAPGITYNFDIAINSEGPKGNATVTVAGEHDAFPAYEIKVSRPDGLLPKF
jgi:RHS repeat-associated protein